MTIIDFWKSIPKVGRIAGVVTAVSGAIVGTAQAWPYIEPFIVAHRGYVTHRVDSKAETFDRSLRRAERRNVENQIELVEIRRSLLEKDHFDLEVSLKNPNLPDQIRGTLELRKRALDEDRKNLDFKLEQLQRTQTGRRP